MHTFLWTVRKPFAPHRNNRPSGPLLIHLLLHLRAKRNRTHDPISKLLIQHRFIRVSIILHNLIKSVDQRLDGWHGAGAATVGEAQQLLCELGFRHVEDGGELLHIFGRGLGLAVEERGDGDFGAAEFSGDAFEGEGFGGFGVEESLGGGGQAVDEGSLPVKYGLVFDHSSCLHIGGCAHEETKQLGAGSNECGVAEG